MDVGVHKEAIKRASVALIRDHGVKQPTMFKWIREAIREYAKDLPKQRVLYNTCFGGYKLSKEFLEFVKCNDKHAEMREEGVQYIVPFAKSVLEKPELRTLADVLHMYHKYKFQTIFHSISDVGYIQRSVQKYKKNLVALREYLSNTSAVTDGAKNPWSGMLAFDKVDFESYSREKLQNVLEKCEDEDYPAKQDARVQEIYDTLVDAIGAGPLKDVLCFSLNERTREESPHGRRKQSFIGELLTKGFDEPNTWIHRQTSYNYRSILYLINKYKSDDAKAGVDFISGESIVVGDEKMYEKFGLLCASGAYADLAIDELPALMDYDIHEYDGKENVCVT